MPPRRGPLIGYALVFLCGFGVGFMYHHIASMAHTALAGDEDRGVLSRLRSVEARLAALEADRAASGGAQPTATLSADMDAAALATPNASLARTPFNRPLTTKKSMGRKGRAEAAEALEAASDGADKAGCPKGRKPYHVVLTAQDSTYQAWQTRVMFYHFKKLQRANPCTEMTGFTRLLSSPSGRHDAMSAEIPTVTAKELEKGGGCRSSSENTCDMGFPVMNRPHAVTQFLANLPPALTEQYVLIVETDHLFMKEPKNRATPSKPVCFPFGYMDAKAKELHPIVAKWVDNPDVVDPCGPSPVLIHLGLLRKLTPEWLSLSFQLKRNPEADKIFGWVLEMWGYTMAATRLGVRHIVWQDFQTEPSSLWHSQLDGDPHIYHYTFGLEYTSDGLPVTSVGEWSLDKRHFMADYPPRQLAAPPMCAGKAAATLTAYFNEASAADPKWPASQSRGTLGWSGTERGGGGAALAPLSEEAYGRSRLAQAIVQAGAWSWEGKSPVIFYRRGRVFTPWGSGTWSMAGDAVAVSLGACGMWRLVFSKRVASFTATLGHDTESATVGVRAPAHPNDEGSTAPDAIDGFDPSAPIAQRLLGSGPWAWTGMAPVAFLPKGRLFTPWGRGVWYPHEDKPNTIHANFVGQKHVVTFDDCWSLWSVRESDGDKATGVARIEPAPTQCPELAKS